MTAHIPASELHAHYKAVRERLYRGAPVGILPIAAPAPPPRVYRQAEPTIPAASAGDQQVSPNALWCFWAMALVLHAPSPWKQIIAEVCEKHGVDPWLVTSQFRRTSIVRCRQEICYRMKAETAMSLPDIGRRLGGRDHTTILHGVRRHARLTGLPLPGAAG